MVDCAVRNGGCEYTCISGTPDRCTCPTGLTLSPSNRTCVGLYENLLILSLCIISGALTDFQKLDALEGFDGNQSLAMTKHNF